MAERHKRCAHVGATVELRPLGHTRKKGTLTETGAPARAGNADGYQFVDCPCRRTNMAYQGARMQKMARVAVWLWVALLLIAVLNDAHSERLNFLSTQLRPLETAERAGAGGVHRSRGRRSGRSMKCRDLNDYQASGERSDEGHPGGCYRYPECQHHSLVRARYSRAHRGATKCADANESAQPRRTLHWLSG